MLCGGAGSLPLFFRLLFVVLVLKEFDEVYMAVDEAQVVPAFIDEDGAGGKEEQRPKECDGSRQPARFDAAVGDAEGDCQAGGNKECRGGIEGREGSLDEGGADPLLGYLDTQKIHPLVRK